ncbi:Cystatin-B [Aquarana catesbeiana]|uniref:Cystatin-B n=1 Tax=Aquarana catesbeiana TaxID=8400 RepID=A0A2G9RAF0_AQUCT|nr:Cystatin-B [Aquarana catesbeiana]
MASLLKVMQFVFCFQVRGQYETKSGTQTSEFTVMKVKTKVVAGTIYLLKVYIGNGLYVHLHVFVPLPGTNEGPKLESYEDNKNENDKLGDC